jgi:hypothetical protein
LERVGRAKAIRLKCIDCCGGNTAEVRQCPVIHCHLWRFRMGKEIKDDTSAEIPSFSEDFEDEDLE